MSFVLGFYVTLVVRRWWEQYRLLPWPDTLALYISAGIPGADERGRLMRRNIVRYAVLAYVITLQRVSLRVKRRFPTWQHVVDSGLMMESEKKIIEMMDSRSPMSKYWMPLVWATNIINRARKESLINSDHIVQILLQELSDIRRRLGGLIGYDTVCVPLVYTQVVTLALYTYFISALIGRQLVPRSTSVTDQIEELDMHFPFFTALQFCFYVGWLKVAEVLINPFGEDDDDIELNWLIDRHIKAAYMIVDEMHEEHPELLRDQYWEEVVPKDLPYTVASEHYRREEPKGSAEKYKVKQADAMYANLMPASSSRKVVSLSHASGVVNGDDMYADYESVDTPIVERRKNWFTRQLNRMGSVRSASTAYSSGGLFGRSRHNSVYASPEQGGLPQQPPPKMSLYDRLVGRRSTRYGGRSRSNSKQLNGAPSVAGNVRNRPRIPTPDVTKEILEQRLGTSALQVSLVGHAATGSDPSDIPVVQVVLSPIQELDGTGSVNNTLHAGQPGTAALAQAVLAPTLSSAGLGALSPVALVHSATNSPLLAHRLLTQIAESVASHDSMTNPSITSIVPVSQTDTAASSRKTSVTSQATAPAGSPNRGEVYV